MSRKETEIILGGRKVKYLSPFTQEGEGSYFKDLQKTTDVFSKFIKYNSRCIDIGARDGDSILPLFSLLSHNYGKITCFEPNTEESKYIQLNSALNGFSVDVYDYGIAEETKNYTFCYDEEGRNGGILTHHILIGKWAGQKQYPCKHPRDMEFEAQEDLRKADFIKIDAEGYDMYIVNTLWDYVNRPVFYIEWWIGVEAMIAEFVTTQNYLVYNPETRKILTALVKHLKSENLILIPKEDKDKYGV